jgi:hypothetical protein
LQLDLISKARCELFFRTIDISLPYAEHRIGKNDDISCLGRNANDLVRINKDKLEKYIKERTGKKPERHGHFHVRTN